jgi:hypothetical protein
MKMINGMECCQGPYSVSRDPTAIEVKVIWRLCAWAGRVAVLTYHVWVTLRTISNINHWKPFTIFVFKVK